MGNPYHSRSFAVQMLLSCAVCILEYCEVLNVYNCKHYKCGAIPTGFWGAMCVNAVMFRENSDLNLPLIVAHALGAMGLMLYSIEGYHEAAITRTEYYDTHNLYFVITFFANLFVAYRFYDRRNAEERLVNAVGRIVSDTKIEFATRELASIRLLTGDTAAGEAAIRR
ncbi:hypothetical protein DIPPA_15905 [Diplonema papillatum]|nr:hypothetical protein DIPPA_15905 [Diplonema papillatum]|eukprot:gene12443-19241_t